MQNPYMETLVQGSSVANRGMANTSNMLNSVANIFNSSASLALKLNALLEQEEAKKQQELLQVAQFMHTVQQDEFLNKMKEKQYELNKQKTEATIDYQNALTDSIKEKQNILSSLQEKGIKVGIDGRLYDKNGSIYEPTAIEASIINYKPPKQTQPKPSDIDALNAINWMKEHNAVIDYKTGKVFNKNTGQELSQVPLSVYRYYKLGTYKTSNKSNNALNIEPTVLSNISKSISNIYMDNSNPLEKITKMNKVSTVNNVNLSTLALYAKKNNPELYGYIVETLKSAYRESLLNGNTKIAQELGSQLRAINPKALEEADNSVKVDFSVKTKIVPLIATNAEYSDNEIAFGGSNQFTRVFNKKELVSVLRENPNLALMVGLTNDINKEARLFNLSRWFKKTKKATISNMINKNFGLDDIDYDFLVKEGVISKESLKEMKKLAKQYNDVFFSSLSGSSYEEPTINNKTALFITQYSPDTKTTVPKLNEIQTLSNKELKGNINKYNEIKQKIVQLFKRDNLDTAYKKVQTYLRQRYAYYLTYGNLDPVTAYKNAKEETFKHFDRKTLGKALLFTYFLIKKEHNNINR